MAKKLRDEDLVLNIIINGNKSKKEMLELERAITDTNKEIRQLKQQQKDLISQGKKETEAYRAATQAIKDKEAAITMAEARLAQLRKGMKLTEMTTGDLRREAQRLKKILDNTLESNPNYAKYKAQLEAVQGRLTELGTKAEKTGFNLRSMADKFNHYIGVVTAGIVTLMGLITGINKIVNTFAEFDDKVADVQKTTGLLKEEVLELNDELKKIDTRTSQENLLGLSRVAGKLGISAKDDVLGFVRAADQIGVALAEDLGGDVEEAINQVGKLVDIFDLKKEFGIEQGLLKVGSAINTLGASSTANEGYLVNFTNRMAGVAPLAGITIDQILGLGATLDQFGQTSEVSSTALSKLFMNMSADAKTYSKYAGQSVDQFKKNLETDFMGTFIKVLEGVKKSSGGINELVKTLGDLGEDGGRVVGVLGVLANNTGTLRQQLDLANQSFVEGTSLSDEFAIKNETAAAKLDKAKKALYNLTVELGQKLYGAVTVSTNGLTYLVKVLSVLIDFVIEHKKILTVLISTIAAYNAVVLIQTSYQKMSNRESQLAIALSKLKIFWNNAERASLHLLGVAVLLAKGNFAAARAEFILFSNALKLSPWGVVLGGLAAVVAAFVVYGRKVDEAVIKQKALTDAKLEAEKATIKERNEIENLQKMLTSELLTRDQKLDVIKRLREIMPEHLKAYSDEAILAGQAAGAISLYVKELQRKALVESLTNRIAEKQVQNKELKNATTTDGKGGYLNSAFQTMYDVLGMQGQVKRLQGLAKEENQNIIKENDIIIGSLNTSLTKLLNEGFDSSSVEGMQKKADQMSKTLKRLQKGSKEHKALLAEIKALNTKIAFAKANPETGSSRVNNFGPSEKEIKEQAEAMEKARKTELAEENKANEQRLKDAGLFGLQRSLMTQDQLEQLAALEKIHQDNINAINKKGQKVSLEQASQALAEIRKRQEAEHKYRLMLINPQSEEIEQENEAHAQRLEKAGLFGKKREQLTAEQLSALEKLEGIHRNKLDKIDADLIAKHIQQKQQAFETELAQLRYKNHQEMVEVNSLEKAKRILSSRMDKQELDKINTLNQAKKALKEALLKEENALIIKYGEDLMKKIKASVDSGALNFEDLKLSDQILSLEEYEVLKAKFLKLAEMMAELKLPKAEKDVKDSYSFSSGKTDVLGFAQEDWDFFFSNLQKGKLGVEEMALAVGALTQAWSIYDQFKTQSENKQLKQYEESTNAQKEKLQQQLDSGRIDQKRYNAEVAKLDKDLDAKKEKIEQAQAKRQKILAVGNIISSTAQAIMSIWAQVPKFDFGISAGILTGVVSAVGAAQLAMVMGLEEGGYVTRAQDGKKFKAKNQGKKRGYIDETSVLVSENGKEFVASADAVGNPDVRQVLDIIDTAQKNGNVSTLTIEKMMYSTPTRSVKGKEAGGYVSDTTRRPDTYGIGSIPQELMELFKQNLEINQKLSKQLDKPIKAKVGILGEDGFIKQMEDYNNQTEGL